MKPSPFTYHRPGTSPRPSASLADVGADGKVLAGGQSLVPILVDAAGRARRTSSTSTGSRELADVRGRRRTASGSAPWPGTPRLERADGAARGPAAAAPGARLVAHPTIRNRGTTVGSLAHADPAAEMPAVLAAARRLGRRLASAARAGATSPAADFFLGPLESALRAGELAVEAFFPALPPRRRHRVRRGRPAARRLRAVRRRRAGRAGRRRRGRRPPRGVRLGRPDARRCVDLTDAVRRRPRRRRDWAGGGGRRAGAARARGRHPRHRRLPAAPGRGADRPGARGRRAAPPATQEAGVSEPAAEQLDDVRLPVNGIAARRRRCRPARLLSDALRHDLGLTGTHVGCEHGVCGACTVLLDGAPGALLPAARGHGRRAARSPRSRGSPRPTARCSPVQQAFQECHGLQCGFCTPGFLTTIAAFLEENPDPTEDEARRRSAATCAAAPATRTSWRRCCGPPSSPSGAGRRPDAPTRRRPDPRTTTRLFGEPVQRRVEDDRAAARRRPLPRRPRATSALARRVRPQPARARPGRSTSTSTDGARRRRAGRDLHLRRPATRPGTGRAAAAADPAPRAAPTAAPATRWPRRGQPRRRGRRRWSSPRDRYVAEDAVDRIRVDYEVLPPVVGLDGRPRGDARSCTTTSPATWRRTWSRRSATPRRRSPPRRTCSSSTWTSSARASHAAGGPGRARPLGRGRAAAADLDLHPDLDRGPRRRRGQARPAAGQGRVHRPGRRRRLRRQDHAPVAGGGAGAVGGAAARPRRSSGPRTGASTSSPARTSAASCSTSGRLRRRRPDARARRHGSGTTTAPTRRTASSCRSSPRPSCSARTSRARTGSSSTRCTPTRCIVTPYRGAGRPQGVFAMERTMDAIADDLGLDRAVVRERNFIQPDEMPVRPRPDLPGRPAADLRLRRLPGAAPTSSRRWSAGTSSPTYRGRRPRRGPPGRHRPGLLRRGHRRRAVRGRARAGRDRRARSRSRPA